MFKAITWCAKCLFLYLIVVILSVRFAWIFTLPVWSIATRFHWTTLKQFPFLLSYFLPIFAAVALRLRFITLQSSNPTRMNTHRSAVRLSRFFGNENVQSPALKDTKGATDRF